MADLISSDSIQVGAKHVVEKMLADIPGGVTLDVTGLTAGEYIAEGTPIILDGVDYKALEVANLVADGPKTVGFLFREIPVNQPHASVCVTGTVNEAKLPFAVDAALKAAVPSIVFI